jgi:cob(I)alamin adenosyltransferase
MKETGKIQVITGEGKGKTTSALGLACRALGRGLRVIMIQFLKAPGTSGEHFSMISFAPNFIIKPMGRKGFIFRRGAEQLDKVMAQRALEEARNAMLGGYYDIVILDEVNYALHLGLVDLNALLELMDKKPDDVELVLTGRYACPEIIERADVVFEMRKIKHHYDEGVPAREGIEY